MRRADEIEILDDPSLPDDIVARAYRDMAGIHRLLGDTRTVLSAIRRDIMPVRRILDVGCGTGLVLNYLGQALRIETVGVDIRPRPRVSAPIPIARADARVDRLPDADVAFCMYLCHHLAPPDLVRMIRNVGRSCRRFIMLDLVRHPLPLVLFRAFVAPFICKVDVEDGRRSVRRSYTPDELREIVAVAVEGSDATFRSSVTPFWLRQIVDISYGSLDRDPDPALVAEGERCLR